MSRKKSTVSSDRNEDGYSGDFSDEAGEGNESLFSWKSMLLVIASLPPRQLQKLDSFLNGVTSEGSDFSWVDFCGYEDIKTKMKRLLRSNKKEIKPNVNQRINSEAKELASNCDIDVSKLSDSYEAFSAENKNDINIPQKLFDASDEDKIKEKQFQISSRSFPNTNRQVEQNQELGQAQAQKIKFQNMHGRVRGIVIHGPSGCGKSFLAKIFAAEVRLFGV
jgi:hypothetical protein